MVSALERRGNHDEIGIAHFRSGGSLQLTIGNDLLKEFLHTRFNDMEFPVIGHFNYLRVDINTYDLNAVLGGNNGCGQADVSKTHETCFHKIYLIFAFDSTK